MTNLQSKVVERKHLLTFILITSLFALWGFANDITNPMVAAFQTIMELSAAKASLVQFAELLIKKYFPSLYEDWFHVLHHQRINRKE